VLAQAGRRGFALGIPDAKVRSHRHVVLRSPLASELNSKTIYLEETVGKSLRLATVRLPS
jgi:hypothetical protein